MDTNIGKATVTVCVALIGPARYNEHIGLYQVMILGIMVVPNTKKYVHT